MSQFVKTEIDVLTSAELAEVRVNRSNTHVDKLREVEITYIFDKWLNDEPRLTEHSVFYKVETEITLEQAIALNAQLTKAIKAAQQMQATDTYGMVIAYSGDGFDTLNLIPMADCQVCAGTGTKAVVDGDTSYSGDDPCECAIDNALV